MALRKKQTGSTDVLPTTDFARYLPGDEEHEYPVGGPEDEGILRSDGHLGQTEAPFFYH